MSTIRKNPNALRLSFCAAARQGLQFFAATVPQLVRDRMLHTFLSARAILLVLALACGHYTGHAQAVAAGSNHSLFLKNDGTVWACGYNGYGQLGDGTITKRTAAVQVSGLTGITATAGGFEHSLFLKNDGTVWACGSNDYGQLGDGTTTQRTTAVKVSGLTGITAIAAGANHSLFLKNDGTVWACGYNNIGQLGDGTTISRATAVQVSGLTGITGIGGDVYHSLFLKNDGTVWACGLNTYGQLGDGTTTDRTTAVQVSGLTGITAIAGGSSHSLFLKNDGTVWACGNNGSGRLGDGTLTNRTTAVQVSSITGITAIAGGNNHSLFLKNDGTVWACGDNNYGQLGDGILTNRTTAVQVSGLTGITGTAGGGSHSLFLKNDGTVWACGYNNTGQLGDGTITTPTTAKQTGTLSGLTGIAAIGEGEVHSLFLGNDGTVRACGRNSSAQLGDGTTTDRTTAVQVSGLTGVTAVAGGNSHSLFLKNDGTVWACGNNSYGQLGDGTTTQRTTAVQVSGLTGITAIAGGNIHSLFLKNDGTVWACGNNGNGQLGDGTTTQRTTPVQVGGLTGITAIEVGLYHSLFLKNDGTVWACGYNSSGQLGDGTTTQRTTAVQVSSLTGITAIEAGGSHSLFLKSDGTVWACGRNSNRQLGDGTATQRNTPVQVSGLTGITGTAGGGSHSLFLKNDGTVWACGYNNTGQLGDGTITTRSTAVQVSGLTDITAIAAGESQSLFLKNDGTIWACGNNGNGQLGDGSATYQTIAVGAVIFELINLGAAPATTTVWYSKAAGDVNNLATWGANADGTGANPTDFTTAGMTYNIVNNSSATIGAAWAPVGTVNVGDGVAAVTFTIPAAFAYSGDAINVLAGSALTITNTTLPALGTLDASSYVTYNATSAQNVAGATYGNLRIGDGSSTVIYSATGNITVDGGIVVNNNATLDMNTNQLSFGSMSGNGTLRTQNTSATPLPGNETFTGTVVFDGSSAQTIPTGNTFTNLNISNTNGVTMAGNTTVNSVLTAGGPITLGSYVLYINGTVTGMSASNCFVANGNSEVEVNGTGAAGTFFFDQTSDGTSNKLSRLELTRTSSGSLTLGNKTALSQLVLNNGLLQPGTNTLEINSLSAPGPGAATHIVTNGTSDVRRLTTGGGASVFFPIGNGTVYNPVTMTVAGSGSSSSYVRVSTTSSNHPNDNSVTNFLNRYWSIASNGITSPAVTITNATFINPGDVSGSTAGIRSAKYASGTWSKYNTATATTLTTSSAITDASFDFSGINGSNPGVVIGNTTICNEQTTTLTATASSGDAPYTYQWYGTSGVLGTSLNQGVSPSGTTVYTVIVTDANTQTAQATSTVTVNPLPVVTNTNPSAICSGISSPIALTSTAGGSSAYTWTVTADAQISGETTICGGACGTSIPQILTNTSDVDWYNAYYHIIPTNTSTGCVGHATDLTQSVIPRPTVTTNSPAAICSEAGSSPIALAASTTTPATFTWTTSAPGQISGHSATCSSSCGTSIAQTLVSTNHTVSLSVIYTVTASADGCAGTPKALTQTVKPLPNITTIQAASTCSNGGSTPISLTATTTIPATYTWVTTADPEISGHSATCAAACGTTIAQTLVNSDNAAPHNVVYVITPTSNGCVGTNSVLTQVVRQHPDVITFSSQSQDACIGTSSTASVTASLVDGSYTFNYTLSGANSGTYTSATVVMSSGFGTFTIPSGQITTAGFVTLTINYVTSNSTLCSSNIPSGNVSSFYVIPTPTVVPAVSSGFPGVAIDINGFDFNTVPDSNYVYFGATRAVVNSASVSQLNVTIPVDATYAPITVVNNYCDVMGYSQNHFIPNFDNAPYEPGNINFSNRVNFNSGANPVGIAMGDIDGDGKTDMIVTSKTNSWVSVYRNMSTSGVINEASFPSRVDFTTGITPGAVAVNDLDNDGKLDLAVISTGSRVVSVLRNTSSGPGSIAFATKIDYTTGFNPLGVATRDLNNDGRSEIVVANQSSGTVSVFQNNSTPGVISFNAKADFATADAPSSVAVMDMNGDGRPDMVTANTSSAANNVSVLLNLNSGGLITSGSFATRVNFAASTNPQGVAVGDLNGDGLPEIVATNSNANSISIFRNTSSGGVLGFAAQSDLSVGSSGSVSPYSVSMGDLDGDSKTDLVVANQTGYSVSVFRNTSSGLVSFEPRQNFTTGSNPTSVAVGDLDGDGKADIAVSNSGDGTFSVLRSNPAVRPISGATTVCQGMTTQLSSATAGGAWSSLTTTIATVDNDGLVSGVTGGTSVISYTVNGATSTLTMTVRALPSAIAGLSTVCINSNIQLSNAIGGGTWSSSNTGVATTNTTLGFVYGVVPGEAEITYATSCGSITTTVTVNPGPTAIQGIAPVCPGATLTLNNQMSGGTWTSTNTAVATIEQATGVATGVAAGNTTIIYLTACGSALATLTTTPLPSPISGTTSICPGATTSLGNTVAGGSWSSSNTDAATIDVATGIVTAVATGTSEITYTTGCGFITTTVTVRALPSAIAGAASVCPAGTVSLSNEISGGTWTSATTSVAAVHNTTGVVTAVAPGTAVITYRTACGSETTTVTVAPLPSAIAGTLAICPAGSTTLSNTVAGGSWTSSNTDAATIDEATGEATGLAPGTTVITYATECGSSTATLTVTTPPAAISGITDICPAGATTLGNAVTGGTWTSATTTVAVINMNTGAVTPIAAGTTEITYATACGSMTTSVVVKPAPSAIAGTSLLCPTGPASTATLSNEVSGGTWTSSNTMVATVEEATGQVTAVASGTFIITYAAECGTATKTMNVAPLPGTITGAAAMCNSGTVTLGNSIAGGAWSSSNTTVASINAATGVVTPVAPGTTVITYELACGSTNITFTVNPAPSAIAGTTSICPVSTTTLSNDIAGGAWSSSNSSIATIHPATGVVSATSTSGNTVITYTTACGSATTTATVRTAPAAITGTRGMCVGGGTALSSVTPGGTWSSDNGSVADVDENTGIVSATGGTGMAAISYNTDCGSTSVTVTVSPTPGTIEGAASVDVPNAIQLSNAVSPGIWSSEITRLATVSASGVVTGVSSGTAIISYSTGTGCAITKNIDVNVACVGLSATLDNGDMPGGTWTSSNITVATVGLNTGVASYRAAGTVVMTYRTVSTTATTTITVQPLAQTTVTGSGTACQGQTISMANSTAGGGTWSSSNTAVATVSTSGLVAGAGAGTAQILFTTNRGCVSTRSVTITPGATIYGASGVCQNQTVTLSSSVTGGAWSSSHGAIASVSGAGFVKGINAGTARITYMMSGGCASTVSVTVASLGNTTGVSTVCQGQYVAWTNSTAGGGGIWSCSNTTVATVAADGKVWGAGAGTANIAYTLGGGCTTSKSVTVNAIGAIDGTTSVCASSTTQLSNSTPGGNWTSSSGALATVSGAGLVRGLAAGTPGITYVLPNGCWRATPLTVRPLNQTTGGTSGMCASGSMTLANNTAGGGVWSSSNTSRATVHPTTGVVRGVGVGTVSIIFATGLGCIASRTVTVNACREDNTTSVAETATEDNIRLFPNPNKGQFTFSGTFAGITDGEVNVEVVNMLGQVIYRSNVQVQNSSFNHPIQLQGNLANGMYLLNLRTHSGSKLFHFIMEQ